MRTILAFCVSAAAVIGNPIDVREEALFVRRIASFWEEGEYAIAKHQMEEFLATFPTSTYADTLRITLGDLLFREKSFQEAVKSYAQVTDPAAQEEIFIRRMQCYYHLQWHATLADECESYLQQSEKSASNRLEATYMLAIALYEQCTHHAASDTEVQTIALRAKPYFEMLEGSDLSNEVAGAFAHLRYILQDFEGSAQIYLNLAKTTDRPEEYLFQAALLQSKYDKTLSIKTFDKLIEREGKFAKDAAYNRLVICFDLGRHEEIIADGEKILSTVPDEKKALVHLMVGQSLLALGKCNEAASEFDTFMGADVPTKSIQQALLQIIETAYRTENLELLDRAIAKWGALDGEDPNLATASFTRAQILKKEGKLEAARKEIGTLLTRFPQFTNRPEAAFSLIQLEAAASRYDACRDAALFFLRQYPKHTLAPNAWHHLRFASEELAKHPEFKPQFVQDLEQFLAQADFLTEPERVDLQFSLAKGYFDLDLFQESINLLEPVAESNPNAQLLLALCYRDDLPLFCEWAEKALANHATLLSKADQHLALFNGYLAHRPEATDLIAKHLTGSFLEGANIELPNLLWLAHYTYEAFTKDPSQAELAEKVIEHVLQKECTDTPLLEPVLLHHAKLLQHLNQPTEAIRWLQTLNAHYEASPDLGWHYVSEARVMLAESLLASGAPGLAVSLFDAVAHSTVLRDRFAATAALQSARIKQATPDHNPEQVLTMLKNIFLQKTLANEPVHLESAIDYIELLTSLQPEEKRTEKALDLLLKTKANFEAQNDLLSKDYHEARSQNPELNQIYCNYMNYLSAKILLTRAALEKDLEQQTELKEHAKKVLQQIAQNRSTYLQQRLEQLEVGL